MTNFNEDTGYTGYFPHLPHIENNNYLFFIKNNIIILKINYLFFIFLARNIEKNLYNLCHTQDTQVIWRLN